MGSPYQIYAMRERHIAVACVCTDKRYVVFDNGMTVAIHGFLDDDHNPTDDPLQYAFYEFGNDEFGYGVGSYDAYDMISWEDH